MFSPFTSAKSKAGDLSISSMLPMAAFSLTYPAVRYSMYLPNTFSSAAAHMHTIIPADLSWSQPNDGTANTGVSLFMRVLYSPPSVSRGIGTTAHGSPVMPSFSAQERASIIKAVFPL